MSDLTERTLRSLWPSFKRRLQARFAGEENWIRAMYLLRCLRVSPTQTHILASLPANGSIIAAAIRRLPEMRALLAPSFNLSLTVMPDDYQLSEVKRRFGIELLPKRNQGSHLPNEPGVLL
jgi:hypothetical protein